MTTEEATATEAAAAAAVKKGEEEKKEEGQVAQAEKEDEDPDLPSKVYAGNLSFETSEDELKAHFESFGKIKAVTIVRNNGKHLGYGFVTFEVVAEAEKAIAELNKSKLREREISVQSARSKQDANKRRGRKSFRGRRGRRGHRGGGRSGGKNDDDHAEGEKDETSGEEKTEADDKSDQKGKDKDGGKRGGRGRFRGGGRGRFRGRRHNPPDGRKRGPPSTTTVFVANIPFSMTDETLEKTFSEAGLQVSSAYVVKGKGRFAEKSKGFGFVELTCEDEQKKAVESMHGKKIEERQISVRVALERLENEKSSDEEEDKQPNGKVEHVDDKSNAPKVQTAAA